MAEKNSTIEDYNFNPRQIGQGPFAIVYRATHIKTGAKYAIKKINKKSVMKNSNLLDRMREEVKIYFELNHPSICQFYDVFEDENSIYQVLQLCENGDFMRFLKKKGRLTEFETRFYMNQIIDCLLYLNRESIIHRGHLTISNLLLDNEGHLFLGDLGLERRINGMTNNLLSSDVLSLGVIMYSMLTGKPLFGIRSGPNETLKSMLPPGVSDNAMDLLLKLLNNGQCISLEQVSQHPFLKS